MPKCTVDDAVKEYNKVFQQKASEVKKLSKSKKATLRKETIYKAFEGLLNQFEGEKPGEIWRMVQKAHVYSYLQEESETVENILDEIGADKKVVTELLLNDELIQIIESAMQSWKRASGLAWEDFFEEALKPTKNIEIKVVNAVDMGKLIKGGHVDTVKGKPTPLHILDDSQRKYYKEILDKKDFDLYLLFYSHVHEKWRLFGLIQCKTSIRDRIKINASTSWDVMEHHLWSVLVALDPDNFLVGQYHEMAQKNWHGVYMLDNTEGQDGRIFTGSLDDLQNLIQDHAKQVLEKITEKPELINPSWHPE